MNICDGSNKLGMLFEWVALNMCLHGGSILHIMYMYMVLPNYVTKNTVFSHCCMDYFVFANILLMKAYIAHTAQTCGWIDHNMLCNSPTCASANKMHLNRVMILQDSLSPCVLTCS